MRFVSFCYLTVLLSFLACSIPARAQIQKLYLNPKSVTREKQSRFIDSIRFIPLEIKPGIQLGASYNVDVTKDYFLLKDYMNKRLLFYGKDGRFVKMISYKKLGGNFYPGYEERRNQVTLFGNNKNYTLTPKDQVKIKMDPENPRNRKYYTKYIVDFDDPSLVLKKDNLTKQDILGVYHYYDDYYLQGQINTSLLYKDSLEHELKVYKNDQVVQRFFPYNRINEPRFLFSQDAVAFSDTEIASTKFLTRPYCDTIYRKTKDSLYPAYRLVLPLENSLPPSFFTKPFKNITERDNFRQNNGWMLRQVFNFYETPKLLFFFVSYFSNFESYIYDKKTELTYKTKNIKTDSTQYNLQLLADFSTIRKGDTFYKSQKVEDLVVFFEKNKTVAVPKELEAFLKSKPAGSTPIIIEFKFKN